MVHGLQAGEPNQESMCNSIQFRKPMKGGEGVNSVSQEPGIPISEGRRIRMSQFRQKGREREREFALPLPFYSI